MIHQIWMADTRENATQACDAFLEIYQAKYPMACECLIVMSYWCSKTSRPSIGSTCGPRIRSSRPSPRSACDTVARKATAHVALA